METVKYVFIRGILFLIPVGIFGIILAQIYKVGVSVADFVEQFIDIERVAGVAIANIIVVLFLILVCFVAGLISYMSIINDKVMALDKVLAQNMPGYTFAKGVFSSATRIEDEMGALKPVLVHLEGYQRVGFEVERSETAVVVFLPDIPTVLAGQVVVVATDQISAMPVPAHKIYGMLQSHGRGLTKVLQTLAGEKK